MASEKKSVQPQLAETIAQLFAQFELVYHNQYNKAYPTADKENYAKRLWLNHLKAYRVDDILRAADLAIRSSEFLPTIYSVLKHLENNEALPNARDAYLECCNAASPKTSHRWSHPLVYWAGKECGWYFLATHSEQKAFTVFKEKYQLLCRAQAQGKNYVLPQHTAHTTNNANTTAQNTQQAKKTLKQLHELLKNS